MNLILIMASCLMICGLTIVESCLAQGKTTSVKQNAEFSNLIGDWSGESVCADKKKFPACKDEVVVYHITEATGKLNIVNLSADKIVNGKPEFIGAFDFVYDPKKQTLTTEFQNSRTHIVMEFLVKGDVLEGTMTDLPDGSLVRRMKVKKGPKPG